MTRVPAPAGGAITGKMTHYELQWLIEDLCRQLGYRFYAPRTSVTAQAGWFDIVIFGEHTALCVELKAEDGRRTRAQQQTAADAQRCGWQYRLWRPSHWNNGTIRKDLETL